MKILKVVFYLLATIFIILFVFSFIEVIRQNPNPEPVYHTFNLFTFLL